MIRSSDVADYVTCRPPILHATMTLGIRDAEVARILGVTPVTVSEWGRGMRPIPRGKHAVLRSVVARSLPGPTKHSPRIEATRAAVIGWLEVADDEIGLQATQDDEIDSLKELLEAIKRMYATNEEVIKRGLMTGSDLDAIIKVQAGLRENMKKAKYNIERLELGSDQPEGSEDAA
jgi:hypothetical protein